MKSFLQIYAVSLLAQIWFTFFNLKFWLSGLKSEVYRIPLFGWTLKTWWGFTWGIWFFNAAFCYFWATALIGWCYKLSLKDSGGLYHGFLVIQIVSIMTSVVFMRLIVGETPDRNGWIALVLVLLASVFAAYSGRH